MSVYESPSTCLDPYEDASRRRQARSIKTPKQRYNEAKDGQRKSGMRIRIYRPISNSQDFRDELRAWQLPADRGLAERRSLGGLAMTLFDTQQQPLKYCPDYTEEELTDLLALRLPTLFLASGPHKVEGLRLFGVNKNETSGHLVLSFPMGELNDELKKVKSIVAPEISLADDHLLSHIPHVSLGKIVDLSKREEIESLIEPVMPKQVTFNKTVISVTRGC